MGTLGFSIVFGIIFGAMFASGIVLFIIYFSNEFSDNETIPVKPQYAQEEFIEKHEGFGEVFPFFMDEHKE